MKTIQNNNYWLVISEIKTPVEGKYHIDIDGKIFKKEMHYPVSIGEREIICHLPKRADVPRLEGVPLMMEKKDKNTNLFKVIESVEEKIHNLMGFNKSIQMIFESLYAYHLENQEAQQQGCFTLEQMKKAVSEAFMQGIAHVEGKTPLTTTEIIQSLQPVWEYVPEMEEIESDWHNHLVDKPLPFKQLKTQPLPDWPDGLVVGTWKEVKNGKTV